MTLDHDQVEIAAIVEDQADRLLRDAITREVLAAADGGVFDAALWQKVSEAGLPLALLGEEAGGIGLAPRQAFRLLRLAGQHALPLPLGETMLFAALSGTSGDAPAGLALSAGGVLPRVAFGADVAVVLLAEVGGWRVVPASELQVTSEGRNIAGAPRVTLTAAGGTSLLLPGWLARSAGEDPVLALRACGALARAAGMAGAMRRVLAMAVDHAATRVQFGRPLARFQAIQHMLAAAAEESAAASAIVDSAAEAWGQEDFVMRAAVAKSRAGLAAGRVAAIGHQVHAAMGFTQEHDLHFFTRRLLSWRDEFGSDAEWDGWIGQRICTAGGGALWQTLIDATTTVEREARA